ncbi:MAG TPA: S46 family peptidase [Bryobacteraceae bacterium]|nr:S46 family peptidase [Bryobacteraceae bacterium]
MKPCIQAVLVASICACACPLLANEGMWLYSQFPKNAVAQKFKFPVTGEFLDNLRLASVRIAGGSGSFVSPHGLILTNQHLISGCLSQHGDLKDGFYAAAQPAEIPCAGLEADVLVKIEDVTKQVQSAAKPGAAAAQVLAQREAAISRIEKDCAQKTGGRCSVVQLYSGVRDELYEYKSYKDIRLVFAPEQQLASFGGAHDSINYLRYGLDAAFLRAYENGSPAATPHYLKWSAKGVQDGDLVFSSGNPRPTARLSTSAQLAFYRDTVFPLAISRLESRIQLLTGLGAQSDAKHQAAQPAPLQQAMDELVTDYKLTAGKLIGLRDDRLSARKTAFEDKIRRSVENNSKLGADAGKVWDQVASAYKTWTPFEKQYQILEESPAPGSELFRVARRIIRGENPDSVRAIDSGVEIPLIAAYLEELKSLGEKNAPIKSVLAGKNPQQAAEALVMSSKLSDLAERRRLEADPAAARKSADGMIRLALALEPAAERLRKKHNDTIDSLNVSAAAKIAQYRLQLFGAEEYPDATSTPRVEFGVVKGYTDRAGIAQPYASTFSGLYYREHNQGPYLVPPRWVDAKAALDPVAPLNFVSTCDIGGGDYGGPVIDRSGELVGVTFDGNLESLPDTYLYSDDQARAVHVAAQGITEALKRVYKAAPLLQELGMTSGL